ncbi:hypothetical protein [uncultured Ruminococcus sp.]|uniref:hypothetical protein n=1 Tax=uncultured Ruminococcus sp. TaxID=165186 RepID=UPI0025F5A237|nr:hypothetical protein [uncultured Ruminococcus sp.]
MAEKEYIERDGLLEWAREFYPEEKVFASAVINAPTADVQEVRHGKWIEKPYLLGTSNFCSLCGENYGMPHGKYKFCPNCGAKMDKE